MRRLYVLSLTVLGLLLASCMQVPPVGQYIWPSRPKPAEKPAEPDVIMMEVARHRVPVGDLYANQRLWTDLDEQILPSSTRLRLQENGIRVGLAYSGRTPDGLQSLLTNDRSNAPTGVRRASGNPAIFDFDNYVEVCEFPYRIDDHTETKNFGHAKFQFQLIPTGGDEGKVHIVFTPQVEFDDDAKWSHLNSNFPLAAQGQRSTETFEPLRFEVTLDLNDYIVIGARLDHPQSLGVRFFVTPDPERPVQRLLAIRAGRFKAGSKSAQAGSQPLASQAASK